VLTNYLCAGEIVNGHLKLTAALAFKAAMRKMPPGPVIVKVGRVKRQRSLDQNAYLHAVPFTLLADHFGDSIEGTKYDLMGHFWGWQPSKIDPSRSVPIRSSTADMSDEECSKFIDWLIPWAAMEHGVLIPLPNEMNT